MRNKQVEFNPYIYTLSKLSRFDYEISVFSSPEPKAQVSYCHSAPSVVRLSSVVCRPSVNFHIFDFSSATAERNSTKLDRKQDLNALYQVCVFSGRSEKQKWPPWPLIGWNIFDFSSETAEQNSTKLDRKQDLNAFYQVCVFRAERKNKMAAMASDWLRHFRLLSRKPLNGIQRNLTGSKISTPSTKFVFSGQLEKQDGRLASDWLRHFRLLLWNRWMEFNETWQEARSQRLLPSLCFSGRSEKQDGRSGLWLAKTFSTSPLTPLNRIQRNLTGSKISTPSTKFVFFGPIWKTKWSPWPLIGWDIFDFSSDTAELNSTKLDRKQALNAFYHVCVFQANREKMATLASDWLRHFGLLLWNCWKEFEETW